MQYTARKRITAMVEGTAVTFQPGDLLDGVVPGEISLLLDRRLAEPVPEPEDLPGMAPEFWPEERVRACRKKDELISYAARIGMTGIQKNMRLDEIADSIVDYVGSLRQELDSGDQEGQS